MGEVIVVIVDWLPGLFMLRESLLERWYGGGGVSVGFAERVMRTNWRSLLGASAWATRGKKATPPTRTAAVNGAACCVERKINDIWLVFGNRGKVEA